MTQDEMQRLLLNAVDEISRIERDRRYLYIAVEQLDNIPDVTKLRVELLLSTYLADTDDALDELKAYFKKLKRAFNNQFVESDK